MTILYWFGWWCVFIFVLALTLHDLADTDAWRDIFRFWKWAMLGSTPFFLGIAYAITTCAP